MKVLSRILRYSADYRCLLLVGLLLRLFVAFVSEQFHHPDEIFNYLEQAHRLVFGYGHIPWEYRFGYRSWVLPGLISGVLWLCKTLQIDQPTIYIPLVKAVSCIIASSLIYSVYLIGRQTVSENAGKLAAAFTCVWYELIYFASRPTPETWATYSIAGVLACALTRPNRPKAVLCGALTGLALVLRPHYLPAAAVLAVFLYVRWKGAHLALAGLGFAAVTAIAGYVDYLTWGSFFAPFYVLYLFTAVYPVADMFGREPWSYYLLSLAVVSGGIFWAAIVAGMTKLRHTWLLLLLVASIVIPHSLIAHKEHRFVVAAIPLLLAVLAVVVSPAIAGCRHAATRRLLYGLSLIAVCGVSVMGSMDRLPLEQRFYANTIFARNDALDAYLFLSKEPDLAGIMIVTRVWQETGGYYYLHRHVPIYYPWLLDLEEGQWHEYVSHIITAPDRAAVPGFTPIARIGSLEIRKQTNPPAQYQHLDFDTTYLYQYGIDQKYEPQVRARP